MSERTVVCGTEPGYRRHQHRKEVPCQPCRDAHAEQARLKRVRKPRPIPECGTHSGYYRHLRLGEETCQLCRATQAARQKARRTTVSYDPIACLTCGETFTPRRKDNAGFCSGNCAIKYRAKVARRVDGTDSERPCVYCDSVFVAKHRDAEVCSKECRHALARFKRHGLTAADYQAMLDRNGHCCEICRKPLGHGPRDRHIDHCHTTGAVRGVLCPGCNLMLGHSKDVPSVLRAAAEYLEHHTS